MKVSLTQSAAGVSPFDVQIVLLARVVAALADALRFLRYDAGYASAVDFGSFVAGVWLPIARRAAW